MNGKSAGCGKWLGWGLVLVGSLVIAGCTATLNLPVEGPDGSLAVVLSPEGEYDFLPEGGVVWVFDPEWNPIGEPLATGDGQTVQVCDWSAEGGLLLLVLDTDEYGFPVGGRLVEWAPDEGSREIFVSEDFILAPRYGEDGRVLFLQAGDERVALWALDRQTGEVVLLQDGVLAFLPAGERTIVMNDDGTFALLGGERLPLEITCEDECQMTFLFFAPILLALDATGRYLAIALEEDPAIVSPEAERMPTLYIVDLVEEKVERIATPALAPAFSPDGTRLAFVGGALGRPVQEVFTYDLVSQEIDRVPNSEGALWVRWGTAGLLAGVEGDPARLVRLAEGEAVGLLPLGP